MAPPTLYPLAARDLRVGMVVRRRKNPGTGVGTVEAVLNTRLPWVVVFRRHTDGQLFQYPIRPATASAFAYVADRVTPGWQQ